MPIRLLLVDDHQIMREGLRSLLSAQKDFQLIGEAESGRAAVSSVGQLLPDVVVMDISMPDLNGIEATRQIVAQFPKVKVVILSAHVDRRFAFEVMDAGAMGLIPKEAAFEELALAIRTVVGGKIYHSPQLAVEIVSSLLHPSSTASSGAFTQLTPREREVLQMMAEGTPTKAIAIRLHLSAKTVETHRRRLMVKLDMDNVAQLTKYAVREGLTSL
jgi:DNA-binding NarL/FixJ family response regulator